MDTIFMNSKRSDNCVVLSNLSTYYTWKIIKKSYENNKFEISAPTWNQEFELRAKLYFISYIQDYFEYIFKKNIGKRLIILQ